MIRVVSRFAAAAVLGLGLAFAAEPAAANPQFDYLTENAQKEGVKVTSSGLQYRVLRAGEGKSPASAAEIVEVHYRGTLIDGTQFDSSYDRGQPALFPLNRVIAGWTEGVQLMQEGAKYEFVIPSDLAYGAYGQGDIPGGATLIFEVELIRVH